MYICIYVYIPCLSSLTHSPSHARSLPMQQTNMKYMDGTPYMKEFTPPPLTADHLPRVVNGAYPREAAMVSPICICIYI